MEKIMIPMTNATRMDHITIAASEVIISSSGPLSIDDLTEEVKKASQVVPATEVSRLDVCESVWRLVDNQVAEFTSDRRVKARL